MNVPQLSEVTAGPLIGKGSFKCVFSVVDRPDLVLIVREHNDEDGNTLSEENAMLLDLEARGFPVAKFLRLGDFDGHEAGLMHRYVIGSRDEHWLKFLDVLNEQTVQDIGKIRELLKKTYVDDLQFLVDADGRVFLSDPLAFWPIGPTSADCFWQEMESLCDAFEAIARYCIIVREGKHPRPETELQMYAEHQQFHPILDMPLTRNAAA